MLGKDEVLTWLRQRGIPFAYEQHDAVLNMAESGLLTLTLDGARCKNLLLQDKKGQYFLVVTTSNKALDLSGAAEAIGSKRLSFASGDTLFELLGIRTGSLSPLALVNDAARRVRLILDADLEGEPVFLFHPLENTASVALARAAFEAFLAGLERPVEWLALPARVAAGE
ncbi:prolyl-tRNA synthetase associated domain-containing protein [Burkholderia sp. Ac-20379]|uniref:prolyl-tRNA synthetase associated domain-containing protein n=1 Tax=Burkholderia sp. Ac-20379 TaxID=2703900 RepID=UPI00197F6742|nr:prolyl-tRNA synthetase associated domain-containing protein [Burkholderia sp. Ac-20379]MBN3723841.1 prolyl-tRNA synthetase associated domain-containing protein [Burkholderia sp. Ac-20379]